MNIRDFFSSKITQLDIPPSTSPSATTASAFPTEEIAASIRRDLTPSLLSETLEPYGEAQTQAIVEEIIKQSLTGTVSPRSGLSSSETRQSIQHNKEFLYKAIQEDADYQKKYEALDPDFQQFLNDLLNSNTSTFRQLLGSDKSKKAQEELDAKRCGLIENILLPIMEKYTKLLGLPEWNIRDSGTKGFGSDKDFAPVPKDKNASVTDLINLGKAAVVGSKITQAILGKEEKLDLNFYNPHHGMFAQEPPTSNKNAHDMWASGEMAGVLFQALQEIPAHEKLTELERKQVFDNLINAYTRPDEPQKRKQLQSLTNDCSGFMHYLDGKDNVEELRDMSPSVRDWYTSIAHVSVEDRKPAMISLLTEKMAELETAAQGKDAQLVRLPQLNSNRESLKAEAETLRAERDRIGTFRQACAPEAVYASSTYIRVCVEDQERIKANIETQAKIDKEGVAPPATLPKKASSLSPFSQLIVANENLVCYLHRKELVDASKYGPRTLAPLRDALSKKYETLSALKTTTTEETENKETQLQQLHLQRGKIDETLEVLERMEAAKRSHVDTHFVVDSITSMSQEQFTEALEHIPSRVQESVGSAKDLKSSVTIFCDALCKDNPILQKHKDQVINEMCKDPSIQAFGKPTNQKNYITTLKNVLEEQAGRIFDKKEICIRAIVEKYVQEASPQSTKFVPQKAEERASSFLKQLDTEMQLTEEQKTTIATTALAVTKTRTETQQSKLDTATQKVLAQSKQSVDALIQDLFKKTPNLHQEALQEHIDVNDPKNVKLLLKANYNVKLLNLVHESAKLLVSTGDISAPEYR